MQENPRTGFRKRMIVQRTRVLTRGSTEINVSRGCTEYRERPADYADPSTRIIRRILSYFHA